MPASYSFDEKLRMLTTRLWGVVTDADLISTARAVAEDPRVGPGTREIIDLREVTRADVTREGIQAAAEQDRSHPEKFRDNRTAIVAAKDSHYGLARMYAHLMAAMEAPTQVQVFRSMADAQEWLRLGEKEGGREEKPKKGAEKRKS